MLFMVWPFNTVQLYDCCNDMWKKLQESISSLCVQILPLCTDFFLFRGSKKNRGRGRERERLEVKVREKAGRREREKERAREGPASPCKDVNSIPEGSAKNCQLLIFVVSFTHPP